MEEKRKFGELELKILNILWEKKQATVLDVQRKLGENCAYTTVMTVLSRLFGKGVVDRVKEGKNYLYTIKEDKDSSVCGMFEKIRNNVFGGNSFQMVNYLLENSSDIMPEDLEKISQMIENKKKEMNKN